MEDNRKFLIFLLVGGLIVAFIILISASFSDVHYYEFGYIKSKTTGAVDTSKVYTGGRHLLGPDKTFKTFTSVAQPIDLVHTTVFAAPDPVEESTDVGQVEAAGASLMENNAIEEFGSESGASLTIQVSVMIHYFLVEEDLKLLHDEYDVNYEELMMSSAQAAIKDTASRFTLKQFYRDRELVEQELQLGVQQRLGGMCCPVDCEVSNCFTGCIPRTSCTDADKGLFVEARYLQLTDIVIPTEVEARNLKTLVITEETAKETFTQQAAVIEKETEQLVKEITNQAAEVTANATARAQLLRANSQAQYVQLLENARREGLFILFDSIGLSTVGHKNSFDYLRSLSDNKNAHLTVDFDQLIVGPTNLP